MSIKAQAADHQSAWRHVACVSCCWVLLVAGGARGDDALAAFDAAAKEVEQLENLLAEKLDAHQPTSNTVATIRSELGKAKLKRADAAVPACGVLIARFEARQAAYEKLAGERRPSTPQARAMRREISDLGYRIRMIDNVLAELLKFDPNHAEAQRLRDKIAADHGPLPFTNSIGMKLVYISPGEFLMGSPTSEKSRDRNETQHRVHLSKGFFVGVHEVTQAQWKAVMDNNPSKFRGDNLPVENVTWNLAVEFCKKLGQREDKTYRLPTEAQWEYVCRAGTTTPFNTGETISTDQANYKGSKVYGNSRKGVDRMQTTPVGSFRPNAWGLYDMHGNVQEWCNDRRSNYPPGEVTNPTGDRGTSRVLRGGSWNYHPEVCRSAHRLGYPPALQASFLGFRVAMD